MGQRLRNSRGFLCGLFLILLYALHMHPPGWGRIGYGEDLGGIELSRAVMAENLKATGGLPAFRTDRLMAPTGMSAAFFSWSLERDWLGALFYLLSPDFPWLWLYMVLSLLIAYGGVGLVLPQLGIRQPWSWCLAAGFVLVNVPRHLKAFHHFEHLTAHWLTLGFFVDAWIWTEFRKSGRVTIALEALRGLLLLLTFNLTGYAWGAATHEWLVVRAVIFASFAARRTWPQFKTGSHRLLRTSIGAALAVLFVQLIWFVPLLREARSVGEITQGHGWPAFFQMLLRPIWLDWLGAALGISRFLHVNRLGPMDVRETSITIGWVYLIPLVALAVRPRKDAKSAGALPFWILLALQVLFAQAVLPGVYDRIIPYMVFFRVCSRMGLYLSTTSAVILAIHWERLSQIARSGWKKHRNWSAAFLASCVLEVAYLATPPSQMPAMPLSARSFFDRLAQLPGDTVFDFPFCMAGGNGVCTDSLCPNYPDSTLPLALSMWHGKKVYGIYLSRLNQNQCSLYAFEPIQSLARAWRGRSCPDTHTWSLFCDYLKGQKSLAAVLVYPDAWKPIGEPACQRELERRLGARLDETVIASAVSHVPGNGPTQRIWRYAPRCR